MNAVPPGTAFLSTTDPTAETVKKGEWGLSLIKNNQSQINASGFPLTIPP